MDELNTDFEKLINGSPVDEANRHQNQEHLARLVDEEIKEATSSQVIHTDRQYRTSRMADAALKGVEERLGRWAQERNDFLTRANQTKEKGKASEADIKQKQILEEKEEKKAQAKEEYMRNNHYSDLHANYTQTKSRFENMRSEMGGKPPVAKKTMMYVVSILFIGVIEWFINYSTFDAKYPSGIAFGATILIALSIAFASHFHGALLKQRVALFAAHRAKTEKRQELIKQAFFMFLLLISIAIVTYNRYDVIADQMANMGGASLPGLPGAETQEPSVWFELWPFVLMNVLVWILGVGISYMTHDSQPDYQEAMQDYEKAKVKFFKVDNGLKEEEKRIDAEYEVKLKAIKNVQQSSANDSRDMENLLERLRKKEDSVLKQSVGFVNDMLEKHQMMLLTSLRQNNLEAVKIGPDLLDLNAYQNKVITIDELYIREKLGLHPF